ncbi:MAG: thioredoxin family protein [Oscillibacter sp.]|nr:thioredoxin family protein [Oscillibacter sp.]
MDAKEEKKKGLWASLFSPKPCSCSCGDNLIVEEEDETDSISCCRTTAGKITEIKVLGPGCAKCKATYNLIEQTINTNHLDVKLTKVDDIAEMMNYNIMSTPAVVVDEVVRLKGHVPTEEEVKTLLGI